MVGGAAMDATQNITNASAAAPNLSISLLL
jgi:hypothetical protein